jgi:hypothetical protein
MTRAYSRDVARLFHTLRAVRAKGNGPPTGDLAGRLAKQKLLRGISRGDDHHSVAAGMYSW